jgi:Protein of unknown function (DUF3768)
MSNDAQALARDAARCGDLNDLCRKGQLPSGRMVFTRNAILACGFEDGDDAPSTLATILAQRRLARAVADFAFDGADDPHRERDFGAFELFGARFFFKIDYYDAELLFGSEDPTNTELTQRVCIVMLASDY